MQATFFQKHPLLKDILSLASFVVAIVLCTLFLNTYIYRSYNVVGASMENTLRDEDRVIVNRAAVSWAHFLGQEYVPNRGEIIVFVDEDEEAAGKYRAEGVKNPVTCNVPSGSSSHPYIIKRVIAFPGERVVVKDGHMTIYNTEHPEGFAYDPAWQTLNESGEIVDGPKKHSSGDVDLIVPDGELFVSGDNREGQHSLDSRNGLGTIPYCRIIGPVILRLFPFDSIRTF
ncbi:MAG: signal peptidase I [Candidatus Saccharibacteria bacterium]|nr:signal peptidase I [Candidatus Saccharibacteria bacterium]